ncbi:hypothetical protein Pla123a_28780 [Posidoniimonas polymericola]|uniref:Uncharacterized protein n=1 Tax=Posidoniimonas polymericola TaxID=2528002 RepID=A0A5C5YML9_9BACT|nr:hypothetical protein [Posidoniimonas polymericola]TWT76089.1 hypothetical protein Pla123a_28780 [Posidoniimonas polymericola]
MKPLKTLSEAKVAEVERLLETGAAWIDVATATGLAGTTVRIIARGQHYHQQPKEEQARRSNCHLRGWVPSLEEIARECERIRQQAPRLTVGDQSVEFSW